MSSAARREWLGLGLVLPVLVALLAGVPQFVREAFAACARACAETDDATVLRASGISPRLVQAIRPYSRLVLFIPYGGRAFVMDANDPRGAMARQVQEMWGRVKNLLYPTPRDVRFACDADELRPLLEMDRAGSLLVLDGTQPMGEALPPLQVGGRYTLLHEEQLGNLVMRLWRWEGP